MAHKCDVCFAVFVRKGNLMRHLMAHVAENLTYALSVMLLLLLKANLRRILDLTLSTTLTHVPSIFALLICPLLEIWICIRRHKNESPYKCNICSAGFLQREWFERHIRTHIDEYSLKRNLKKLHMMNHTGEKPYKCNIYGVAFSQKGQLKIHTRTHTGERLFKCNICGVCVLHKENLKTHMKTHAGEKPYKCNICGVVFVQKAHLKTHLRTHTGENHINATSVLFFYRKNT